MNNSHIKNIEGGVFDVVSLRTKEDQEKAEGAYPPVRRRRRKFFVDFDNLDVEAALRVGLLDDSPTRIGFTFGVLSNFFKDAAFRLISQEYGLSGPEIAVVFCLGHRNGLTAQDVCTVTLRPKNSISRAVKLLLRNGFITRNVDKDDGRRRLLFLSPRGKSLFDNVIDIYRGNELKMLEPLTDGEVRQLGDLLRKLVAAATIEQ